MEFIHDILRFTVAVVSHWQAFVTGGVVTGLIVVIERLTSWTLSKKAFVAIFIGFYLLAAFYLTWKDEYKRAESLQAELANRPTQPQQVNVNIPPIALPPPTVIVQPSSEHSEPGYLQLGAITPVDGAQKIVAGQPLYINVFYVNKSTRPVEHIKHLEALELTPSTEEKATRERFAAYLDQSLKHFGNRKSEANLAPSEAPMFNTVVSKVLTQSDVDGLVNGSLRMYLHIYASWDDLHGTKGKLEDCYYLLPPTNRVLTPQNTILHNCSDETRVPRRPGSSSSIR